MALVCFVLVAAAAGLKNARWTCRRRTSRSNIMEGRRGIRHRQAGELMEQPDADSDLQDQLFYDCQESLQDDSAQSQDDSYDEEEADYETAEEDDIAAAAPELEVWCLNSVTA